MAPTSIAALRGDLYRRARAARTDRGAGAARRLSLERERRVPIAATALEHLSGSRQLVVDLEQIAVRIVEVEALLAHVVDGARDLHAVVHEGEVRGAERLLAVHLEGDVLDAESARHRGRREIG